MIRRRRRSSQEDIVEKVIKIIQNKIAPRFNDKRRIAHLKIHKQPDNQYFRTFLKIVEYAEEERGDNKNPLESVIKDYIISVYSYYEQFNRIPKIHQLSPTASNQIRFQEWIHQFTRDNNEEYFTKEDYTELETITFDQNFAEPTPDVIEV